MLLTPSRAAASGVVRITCTDDAIEMVFRSMLKAFLRDYPEIKIELIVDYGFTNIVDQRIDPGVRLGETIDREMVAVRIGPDCRFAVVGTPEYFARRAPPATPQDLTKGGGLAHLFRRAFGLPGIGPRSPG